MSIQFRLKLPNVVDYTDILLKNGTCCDGYTAIPGASYSSYHDCNQQGFYFIAATGENVCKNIGMTASIPVESVAESTWINNWGNLNVYKEWPWDSKYKYKFTSDGSTLQFNKLQNSVTPYWNNSEIVENGFYLIDRNLIYDFQNYHTINPFISCQPEDGTNSWNQTSALNNGYAMPGSTEFSSAFFWNQNNLNEFIQNVEGGTAFIINPQAIDNMFESINVASLMELSCLKQQHPDRLTLFPRALHQKLAQPLVGSYWYSTLVDGFTGLSPRGKTLQVNSPWNDTVSEDLSKSFGVLLKMYSDVGITFSYIVLDDEYINQGLRIGSYTSDYDEELSSFVDITNAATVYIPDRDYPLPGMKGTTGFDEFKNPSTPNSPPSWRIASFPHSATAAPQQWEYYQQRGITWWNFPNTTDINYVSKKNPNGNSIWNVLNNSKWDNQGLTHLGGLTLGAVFTKHYNNLRNAWIAAYAGASFPAIEGKTGYPSASNIPPVNEVIEFFKGWSGHFLKGTTHKVKNSSGITLFSNWSHLGETKAWLPAMGLFNLKPWPQDPRNEFIIDGITLDQFLAWTPYNRTQNYYTQHNFKPRPQTIWNHLDTNIFGPSYMNEPTLFSDNNYQNSWGWWLNSVFWPAWDCTISNIQSNYYYNSFHFKQKETGRIYNGVTFSIVNYSNYNLNAEEAILTNGSNSLEFGVYQMNKLNNNFIHSPVYYLGNYGWGNIGGKRHYGEWIINQNQIKLRSIIIDSGDIGLTGFTGDTGDRLNEHWSYRMGYVKGSSFDLEKYKPHGYIQRDADILGMGGTTLYPPPSGSSYFMKRWPTDDFMGLTSGGSFTDIFGSSVQLDTKKKSANKLKQATTYANILFYLQNLRGIFRTDPYAYTCFAPWIDSTFLYTYETELLIHILLHNPKFLNYFELAPAVGTRNSGKIKIQKLLTDLKNITKGGNLVPVGCNEHDQCFPSGTGAGETLMNRLSLEKCFEDYIMTGAKITSGPLDGNYIWRITPSPVNINWGITLDMGNLGITVDNNHFTQNIGNINVPDRQRTVGIYFVKNDNIVPSIVTSSG
jgi:hypothetical protein